MLVFLVKFLCYGSLNIDFGFFIVFKKMVLVFVLFFVVFFVVVVFCGIFYDRWEFVMESWNFGLVIFEGFSLVIDFVNGIKEMIEGVNGVDLEESELWSFG